LRNGVRKRDFRFRPAAAAGAGRRDVGLDFWRNAFGDIDDAALGDRFRVSLIKRPAASRADDGLPVGSLGRRRPRRLGRTVASLSASGLSRAFSRGRAAFASSGEAFLRGLNRAVCRIESESSAQGGVFGPQGLVLGSQLGVLLFQPAIGGGLFMTNRRRAVSVVRSPRIHSWVWT
jgi:hypothetical protein